MKKLQLLKSMLLLFALIVGSTSLWASTGGFSLKSTTTVPLAADVSPATTTIDGTASETWTVDITGTWTSSSMQGSAGSKYWQMGKKDAPITSASFSTSGIPGTITQVVVACYSYNNLARINCSVGGSAFGTQNQSSSSSAITNVTFSGSASGTIDVTLDNSASGARAVYIQSITVTYSSTFTVTYNPNGATGGSVPEDDTAYDEDASVTVLGNTGSLVRTNYIFAGWNTKANGTGTSYVGGNSFLIKNNTTLYAQWIGEPYTVTMPADDEYGTYTMSPANDVPYGTEVTLTYAQAAGKEAYGAKWSVDGDELDGNTFVMPAKDVIVTVSLSDKATIPFNYEGGTQSELLALAGFTADGLGTDYADSNAPYRVKFDDNNDYIQINTATKPGIIKIGFKVFTAIASNAGTKITIQGSTNGDSFTDVEEFSLKGTAVGTYTLTTTNTFSSEDRYVRILFTKGSSGQNVGIGPISIAVPEPAGATDDGETVTVPVSANMDGWRSFYDASQNFTVADGTKVYYVSATNAGTSKVTLAEIDGGVPANTPVILHKDGATSITLTKTATAIVAPSGNKLSVSAADQDLSAGVYRLGYKSSDGVGFYKYSSASAPAGIIYISALDAAANFLSFDFGDGGTTGISEIKKMRNGENETFYNLAGQRVNASHKGIVIVNGKKVVIK